MRATTTFGEFLDAMCALREVETGDNLTTARLVLFMEACHDTGHGALPAR